MRVMKIPTSVRVISALIADTGAAALGAYLLWSTGTVTVVDGPLQTFVTIILATGTSVAIRSALLFEAGPRARGYLLGGHLLVLAAVLTGWLLTDSYYLGWQATYCAVLFAVASIFGALRTALNDKTVDIRSSLVASWTRELVGLAAAGVALVLTASIHEWSLNMLNTLFVTMVIAVSAGAIVAAVVFPRYSDSHAPSSREDTQDRVFEDAGAQRRHQAPSA